MQRSYTLLLHETVRAHILSLNSQAKHRLREKLEFLQGGLWDAGVRVKKLKGTGRTVFEARLSRGDRILFTLGEPAAGNGADHTRVYVWGVVKHDEVTAAERRIVPANAPFLDFQPTAVEELPEFDADSLGADYFSPALDRPTAAVRTPDGAGAATDAGPHRWLVVDDEEWRRLQAAHPSDHVELYLFLTHEQVRLLHGEPPLLLSGTAGSGKTTIAVYFLLRHRVRQLAAASGVATIPPGAGSPAAAAGREHLETVAYDAAPQGRVAGGPSRPPVAGSERALFLTCSAHLKRFSERIYRGLVKATDLESVPEAARFATFGELLAEIMTRAGRPEWQSPPVGLAEFHAIFRNHPGAARYDTELVWEEIRAIIKGAKPPVSRRRFGELAAQFEAAQAGLRGRAELAEYVVRLDNLELGAKLDGVRARKTSFATLREFAASLRDGDSGHRDEQLFLLEAALRLLEKQSARIEQPLLTQREYEGLGRKRAPNFPFDRSDIYRIAEYYQERLETAGRYDEIDLTRAALQHLERHGDQFRYDLVVCDEVQDFTDMQLALLFRLATDPRQTVLTGDPKQIINPSGFRWEEVRARYYERGLQVPEVINLSINFRSVGNIVSLANRLLQLKRALIGLASGEITERWTFRGRPPLLVEGLAESDLLGTLLLGGAGQVVLVRTEQERNRLRKALRTELVFTINEAKGLEFEAVLLWRFSAAEGSPAIWRRIADDRVRGAADSPHIRHELNLLYVAVTRARNTLVIWDGEQVSPIWTIDALADQVYRTADAAAFGTLWRRVSTPAEWEAQGDYFAEREHFAAAEECYRHAQAGAKEALARANRLEREGEHHTAAGLFALHGRTAQAAENLERAEAFAEAARAWRRAGREMRAVACEARHYETAGNYTAAAKRWQELGVEEGVVRNWERGRDFRKLAAFHLARKDGGEAARYLKLAGDHAAAAVQFRRAGFLEFAAQEFEQAGDHAKAAALYRRLGDRDALLRSLLNGKAYHDAGLEYEKRGDLERAVDCFRRYAASSPEARQDLEQRLARISPQRPGMRAAVRMVALGQLADAAPIYQRRGYPERATELFTAVGQHDLAAQCLAQCGQLREAAREVARGGGFASVMTAARYLADYVFSAHTAASDRVTELNRTAGRLLRGAAYERALAHYLALDRVGGGIYVEGAVTAFAALDRHADALAYCVRNAHAIDARAYVDARPDLVLPVADVESLMYQTSEGNPFRETDNDPILGVLVRVMHDCLYRGTESDRRERIAAILDTVPPHFGYFCRLFPELSDMMIDLRVYPAIVGILGMLSYREPLTDEDHRYFVARLEQVAARDKDPELALCTVLNDSAAFEAAIATIQPTPRNVPLFENSSTRYREAVALLLETGDPEQAEQAAVTCVQHGAHAAGGKIYEDAGDLLRAARTYRDGGLYADARRCYAARGDEAGVARVFEREQRHEEALAIWQRLGRKREVERLRKKMPPAETVQQQPGGKQDQEPAELSHRAGQPGVVTEETAVVSQERPVKQPAKQPAKAPAKQPAKPAAGNPVEQPAKAPAKQPSMQPAKKPAAKPVKIKVRVKKKQP